MAHNRKQNVNTLPAASLARWIFVAFFIGVTGLGYVYLKNQYHRTGDEIRNLERTYDDLVTQNNLMHGRISTLSSRTTLQRRLNEGFIKMIPVSDDRIVRVNVQPARVASGEIRAVSNEVAAK
jgi:hypothetical protein